MKKFLFIYLLFSTFVYSQVEYKYDSKKTDLPYWVKEMYSKTPDPGKIELLYNNYYKENKFIKNKHTQYYKRWKRSLSREINAEKTTIIPRNNRNSNLFGSITYNHEDYFKLDYDYTLDTDLSTFNYNSLSSEFTYKNFTTELNIPHVWLPLSTNRTFKNNFLGNLYFVRFPVCSGYLHVCCHINVIHLRKRNLFL